MLVAFLVVAIARSSPGGDRMDGGTVGGAAESPVPTLPAAGSAGSIPSPSGPTATASQTPVPTEAPSASVAPMATPVAPSATPRPSATPSPSGTRQYTVRSGDTLSGIAAQFGTTVKVLKQLNNIDNVQLIRVGQVLVIP